MKLSPTSYEAFWSCPERYRLSRLIAPAEKAAPLREGVAFHAAVEAHRKGWFSNLINDMLLGNAATPDGTRLDLSFEETERVRAWFEAWLREAPPTHTMLAVEAWYEVPLGRDPITDEAHSLYGRVDGIVVVDGVSWVHEIKTRGVASPEALLREARTAWPRRMQLRAETMGAQALGFNVAGVLLELVSKQGSNACVRVPIRFTGQELQAAAHDLLHTAQTITIMHSVAPNGPWPHPALNWPCKSLGACEYEAVCMKAGAPDPDGIVWVKPTRPEPTEGQHETAAAKTAVPAPTNDPEVVRVA